MVDDDGQIFVFEVFIEKIAQLRLWPNQVDADRQSPAGENCPPDLWLWSFIGTYGVKNDVCEHRLSLADGFLDFNHGAALVGSALGAGVVRQLGRLAVGAVGCAGSRQKIV